MGYPKKKKMTDDDVYLASNLSGGSDAKKAAKNVAKNLKKASKAHAKQSKQLAKASQTHAKDAKTMDKMAKNMKGGGNPHYKVGGSY